jgi:hypothetical protein
MKKFMVLLLTVFFICGCGVTQKATDGSDGSDGANGQQGQEGRDFITPVLYSYSFDASGTYCSIDNPNTTNIKLKAIGFEQGSGNFIDIWVPAGYSGHELRAVINGVISLPMVIPNNVAGHYLFIVNAGTDTASERYMTAKWLNNHDTDNYFSWFLDGTQKEMFFSDSFKSE